MQTSFEELNLYAYHWLRGLFYDAVIWCLGPLVDDTRRYGVFRRYLSVITCDLCRRYLVQEESDPRP